MTDVERFFRRLVSNLAASDPARLRHPVPLDDILRDILPYRANRRVLRLDTSEDYELVLLRLCAGEGSLVRTEPEEARARFAREAESSNPDLEVLHSFEHVQVTIRPEPLSWALAPYPDPVDAPSPPHALDLGDIALPGVEVLREPSDDAEEPAAADPDARPMCLYCGGSLPAGRPVNFCPHCGQSQTQLLCPECRSEVEPGWRHCVNCGAAVGEG
ncbi:MAG TPA: zinc ribbon domain-containing protein [Gemmatimonadales bacterium]|nr:zinc ribbon domain-containing protein [Gemmatimonadales bacterium]